MRVSTKVHRQIVLGHLAIVCVGDTYELVPRVVANKIAQRDPAAVLVDNYSAQGAEVAEDDPYKDYVIPDDLMW